MPADPADPRRRRDRRPGRRPRSAGRGPDRSAPPRRRRRLTAEWTPMARAKAVRAHSATVRTGARRSGARPPAARPSAAGGPVVVAAGHGRGCRWRAAGPRVGVGADLARPRPPLEECRERGLEALAGNRRAARRRRGRPSAGRRTARVWWRRSRRTAAANGPGPRRAPARGQDGRRVGAGVHLVAEDGRDQVRALGEVPVEVATPTPARPAIWRTGASTPAWRTPRRPRPAGRRRCAARLRAPGGVALGLSRRAHVSPGC